MSDLKDLGVILIGESEVPMESIKGLLYSGSLLKATPNELREVLKSKVEKEPFITLDLELESNANPYVRTTQKAKFVSPAYQKYREWKEFLRTKFTSIIGKPPEKIFDDKTTYFVEVLLVHKNRTYGDADNILKGVNDSLFTNDKNVSGAVYFAVERSKKARIVISFYKGER